MPVTLPTGRPPRDLRNHREALQALPDESYGHKLRRLRLALGMTQAEVAEMIGCSKMTISLWECGKRYGNSPEAAALPRRAIYLLGKRLRHRQREAGVTSLNGREKGPQRATK